MKSPHRSRKRKTTSKERRAFPSNFFCKLPNFLSSSLAIGYTRLNSSDVRTLLSTGAVRRRGLGVAKRAVCRCRWGKPQVIVCSGMMGATPFPTSFWLVCPHLSRQIGRLEGENAVDALQGALAGRDAEAYRYHRLHSLIRLSLLEPGRRRFLRLYRRSAYRSLVRGGVGGIAYEYGRAYVKCLHLQTASLLALGFHPGAEFLSGAVTSWECDNCDCE